MKPKPAAVNGKIPIDLIRTKILLAFLSRVRLIYSGQIWDNPTNITEIRTWLLDLTGVGLAVSRERRAGCGLRASSGSQSSAASAREGDNNFLHKVLLRLMLRL